MKRLQIQRKHWHNNRVNATIACVQPGKPLYTTLPKPSPYSFLSIVFFFLFRDAPARLPIATMAAWPMQTVLGLKNIHECLPMRHAMRF